MPFPDSEYPSVLRGRHKRESQRLLAAAPDLLSACQRLFVCLVDWVEIADEDDQSDRDYDALEQARRAISKAKGGE